MDRSEQDAADIASKVENSGEVKVVGRGAGGCRHRAVGFQVHEFASGLAPRDSSLSACVLLFPLLLNQPFSFLSLVSHTSGSTLQSSPSVHARPRHGVRAGRSSHQQRGHGDGPWPPSPHPPPSPPSPSFLTDRRPSHSARASGLPARLRIRQCLHRVLRRRRPAMLRQERRWRARARST